MRTKNILESANKINTNFYDLDRARDTYKDVKSGWENHQIHTNEYSKHVNNSISEEEKASWEECLTSSEDKLIQGYFENKKRIAMILHNKS